MHKCLFTIDGFNYPHIGYTEGKRWNGWATPYFEVAEAILIMEEFNKDAESPMQYDEVYDQFYILYTDGELETWKGKNYQTEEGMKHLYGIGAYSWVWEDVTDGDICAVARRIEDFLWELDTYEHRDQYADREDFVNAIIKQLQDFKTLKQVLIALYTEDLRAEELFDKLGGILRV